MQLGTCLDSCWFTSTPIAWFHALSRSEGQDAVNGVQSRSMTMAAVALVARSNRNGDGHRSQSDRQRPNAFCLVSNRGYVEAWDRLSFFYGERYGFDTFPHGSVATDFNELPWLYLQASVMAISASFL